MAWLRTHRDRIALVLAWTLLAQGALVAPALAAGIEIENAWSRATPGRATVGVGFATIKNNAGEADRLLSATTAVAAITQIHQMFTEGGVMKMREVTDGVPVPAKGEVALTSGSYHLMLMDLKHPLKEGEHFSGTLNFEKAGPVTVEFHVKGLGASGSGNPHAGH
jgi:copper(I)-binding protein